ncbi:Serine/threonine-protein phosphatase [Zea mays]|uniref:Serine/threonine-protein phosphatase n=1 Tax=Zea mays TaxID=4577 RepID=A0A1D6KVN5_MAIZE|nr:Serine/threonine-protein phosphatase [Zea mays]
MFSFHSLLCACVGFIPCLFSIFYLKHLTVKFTSYMCSVFLNCREIYSLTLACIIDKSMLSCGHSQITAVGVTLIFFPLSIECFSLLSLPLFC